MAGFTLVELLLSVTLMSLLLALAYGGMRAATRATTQGQAMLEETGKLRLTHQFVRRQLNQMLALPFYDENLDTEGEPTALFTGSAAHVQFVAPMPGYLGSGGPHVQRLEFVDADQGLELHFRHALWQGFDPEFLFEREPVVLLEGLEFAGFEFLDIGDDGLAGSWAPEWIDTAVMPLAVRLEIDLGEESSVYWPSLATGIRVDATSVRQAGQDRTYDEQIRDLIRGRQDGGQ